MNWKAANWVSSGLKEPAKRSRNLHCTSPSLKYLKQVDAFKKPNTLRKYEAVLNRFGEFFRGCVSIDAISGDDLTRFVVTLKKDHGLGSNTIPSALTINDPRLLGRTDPCRHRRVAMS